MLRSAQRAVGGVITVADGMLNGPGRAIRTIFLVGTTAAARYRG